MPECPFQDWTEFRGVELRRTPNQTAYFYLPAAKSVDADGAPNAYHPDDVDGHSCPDQGTGLECPANAGYYSNDGVGNSNWWRSVLVPDPADNDVAYVQQAGDHAGYFVSQTALQNLEFAAHDDPRSYVDATEIPYVVMPGPFHDMIGTGRMGDLGYALNLDNGAFTPFVFADIGPDDAELGEASIAFWTALGGNDPNPRNGDGVPNGRIAIVAFPYSGAQVDLGWPIDLERLREAAAARMAPLGGDATIRACAD